ncbi:hypothetical protein Y032_0007g3196 [Ancylostoma ceylanicum]|uniref:Uncharacterized protein n=1 Tax=Ancylostoma ceylanicum TaxID=53326 RepID=A0A016VNN5_9BILA|nr:hypothetical protein Y032_0007g3196 [Ancylostoma ceylanicum]
MGVFGRVPTTPLIFLLNVPKTPGYLSLQELSAELVPSAVLVMHISSGLHQAVSDQAHVGACSSSAYSTFVRAPSPSSISHFYRKALAP